MSQLSLDFENARSVANRNQVYHSLDPVKLSGMRAVIMQLLAERGPSTRDEIAMALGKPVHEISGRFTALLKAGLIEETDQRRPTRTGHSAVVVRVKA